MQLQTSTTQQDKVDENSLLIGHISYGLHMLVALGAAIPGLQISVWLLVVALIIDLIKRNDYPKGSATHSHFAWRLRTVGLAIGLYIITIPLWLLIFPGIIAWILIGVWFLYKIIKGWLRLKERLPIA